MTDEDERSTNEYKNAGKEWLSCRDVLWILVFSGFIVDAFLQTNMIIAIVAMTVPKPEAAAVSQCKYDLALTSKLSDLQSNASSFTKIKEHTVSHILVSSFELKSTEPPMSYLQYPDRFAWNEYQQGLILGGICWFPWATQLPGGFLAHRYGTKFVFGMSNFASALLGFLIPFCARYHLYAVVSIRALQGFFAGFAWPSMHNMTAKWIPIHDRSKFVSSYLGSSGGIAMSHVMSAMIINWFGWESVFYVTSVIGVIWSVAWYYLAYDTPQEHPRISHAEKTYILKNLQDSVNHDNNSKPIPWKAILTSGPLWITIIVTIGGNWGFYAVGLEGPSYFNYVHGWNINATSVFAATPQLGRILFSYLFSMFVDWLKRTNKLSTTKLRKFAMLICNGVQGILLLGVAYSGCHPILAIVFIIAAITASGSIFSGALASFIDLSPNYASILFGISNTLTSCVGIIIPLIVGTLTNNNQTIEQWRLVFLISAVISIATGTLYIFFGESELQYWNHIEIEEKGGELQKLQSNVGLEANCVEVTEVTCDGA